MSAERLQKVLASAGIASRRDCEELISAGRVAVNGKVVRALGTRVDLDHDQLTVDNQPIGPIQPRTYVMLNKPTGVISTVEDTHDRPAVVDLVDLPARLFPVGRLDQESEGLLLLTDDGMLTQRLTHPSYAVEKEYRALLDRVPTLDALREWREGVELDGTRTVTAWVDVVDRSDAGAWVRVVLHEGRKRQIREVARLLGYKVLRLIRVREGPLLLGDLPTGGWRHLTEGEVAALWEHTGGRTQPRELADGYQQREVGGERPVRPPRPTITRNNPPTQSGPGGYGVSRPPAREPRQERPARGTAAPRRDERGSGPTRNGEGRGQGQGFGPRRDERGSGPARNGEGRGQGQGFGPRRDERSSGPTRSGEGRGQGFGPRRDERGANPSGPRRYNNGTRNPTRYGQRSDAPETPRNATPLAEPEDGRPAPGNERVREQPAEKRGPGRNWRAQQEQELRERKQRSTPYSARRPAGPGERRGNEPQRPNRGPRPPFRSQRPLRNPDEHKE